ncbi:hypothetical protein Cni_G19877 [Canna indica]|uniref:Reverse transcriptase zinc-binding domain-containing protein n=1 Tax=Canna indica TaxID=4628 RepID=A0AAQ3QIY1_9LILI|nr:hypothetical protein Cni_G19877 [Canna indica]
MSVTWINNDLCSKIEGKIRSFLWRNSSDKKCMHLVNWDTIALPKDCGGLGIHDLRIKKLSLQVKRINCYLNGISLIWVDLVKVKYLHLTIGNLFMLLMLGNLLCMLFLNYILSLDQLLAMVAMFPFTMIIGLVICFLLLSLIILTLIWWIIILMCIICYIITVGRLFSIILYAGNLCRINHKHRVAYTVRR